MIDCLPNVEIPSDNYEFTVKPEKDYDTATVNVYDPLFTFNVTSSFTFERIRFRGEHALARWESEVESESYSTLARMLVKKC